MQHNLRGELFQTPPQRRSAGLTKSGDFCAQIPIDTALSTQQKTLLHITHFALVCHFTKNSDEFLLVQEKSQCAPDLVSDS